jgi:hypothetical protein
MPYLITYEKHPELFKVYNAPKGAHEYLQKKDGKYLLKQEILLEDFYNKETKKFNFPFPLDSVIQHEDFYRGRRKYYFLTDLVEKQLYHRFQKRMDATEYLEIIKPMFEQLTHDLKKENKVAILYDVIQEQLNSAHYQDIRCFIFLTQLIDFDFNTIFTFDSHAKYISLGAFGFTPLMLAKGKKFVDYLIERKVDYNILSTPLKYYSAYEQHFKENPPNGTYRSDILDKKYFEKREGKKALEIGMIEKRKYLMEGIKKDILLQKNAGNTQDVSSLEHIEKSAYEKIIQTKKISTRFNLLAKELKNNNQYLYHHLDNPILREVFNYVDGHKKDLVYYAIKHKNIDVLTYLTQQPEILDMAQKHYFRMQDASNKSYLFLASEIGNKNLVKILYDAHFYLLDDNSLIDFSFKVNIPEIFKNVYQNSANKGDIHLEYLLSQPELLKEHLASVEYDKNNLKETIVYLTRVIYALSPKKSFHPVLSYLSYGSSFNDIYFTLAKEIYEDEILPLFIKGSEGITKNTETIVPKFYSSVKKNLFDFFQKFTQHYPHLEKESFGIMAGVIPENQQFITYEKKLLNSLLNAKINHQGEKKKNKI